MTLTTDKAITEILECIRNDKIIRLAEIALNLLFKLERKTMYSATVTDMTKIDWAAMWAEIQRLIKLYGPGAIAYIESFLSSLGLPSWLIPIIDSIINVLFGLIVPAGPTPHPVFRLDVSNCGCID